MASAGAIAGVDAPNDGDVGDVAKQAGALRATAPVSLESVQALQEETASFRAQIAEIEASEDRVGPAVEALRSERACLIQLCEQLFGFVIGFNGFPTPEVRRRRLGRVDVDAIVVPPSCGNTDEHGMDSESLLGERFGAAHQARDQAWRDLERAKASRQEAEEYLEWVRDDVEILRRECDDRASCVTLHVGGEPHVINSRQEIEPGSPIYFEWSVRVGDKSIVCCEPVGGDVRSTWPPNTRNNSKSSNGRPRGSSDLSELSQWNDVPVSNAMAADGMPGSSAEAQFSRGSNCGYYSVPCQLRALRTGTTAVTVHRRRVAGPPKLEAVNHVDFSRVVGVRGCNAGTAWSRPDDAFIVTVDGIVSPERTCTPEDGRSSCCPSEPCTARPTEPIASAATPAWASRESTSAFLGQVLADAVTCQLPTPSTSQYLGSSRELTPSRDRSVRNAAVTAPTGWSEQSVGSTLSRQTSHDRGGEESLAQVAAQFRRVMGGRGLMRRGDLARLLKALERVEGEWSDARVERLLGAARAGDNGGPIPYEEFLGWLFGASPRVAAAAAAAASGARALPAT
eukprot:TRINITY_DN51068_c0_g1_i1.p1 TRINITY_DN51068_c0_g1~~TRINITY_DN51068_c0_g1_i1.p1  ORF type:complete len:581 (-),score=64.32 TRINITY_DN51068_c0_g1_i1:172-1875(-)